MIKKIKRTINDMDKPLLIVTVSFIIFGLLNLVTASSREAVGLDESLYFYFFKQLKILLVCLIGSIVVISMPTKDYSKFAKISFIGIGAILLYLLVYGSGHRGAKNWISIMGFTFQPSEFAKPVIIICLALYFEKHNNFFKTKGVNHWNHIATAIFIGISFAGIIFLQKDFGTMFIICCIFGVMFMASPILKREKTLTYITVIGTIFIIIMGSLITGKSILSKAQLARFDFFNPCTRYEDGGYQTCNGFIAINDGGLLGLGIGKSKQKYSYIPEPHTDSVFAIFVEEWGLVISSIIFVTYLFILKRILDISSRASTLRGRYIALGVATYIFMHIIVNLGGLFGIMPLTGVPLPFLSYGGSFSIALIMSLAIVQKINIETKRQKIKV